MYSEAKSTPVRPPGQKATAVIFDPHRPVCPCAPPTPAHSKMTLSTKFLSSNTHTVMLMQLSRHSEQLSAGTQLLSLTFFLQEGFSGGQRTLTHFRVLEKFHSCVNLEREERSFSLGEVGEMAKEKKKTTGSFQIETHPPTINGFHLIVSSEPPHPVVRKLDHLTTFQLNVGNDQISSYKISPSRVLDKWRMELNLLLRS